MAQSHGDMKAIHTYTLICLKITKNAHRYSALCISPHAAIHYLAKGVDGLKPQQYDTRAYTHALFIIIYINLHTMCLLSAGRATRMSFSKVFVNFTRPLIFESCTFSNFPISDVNSQNASYRKYERCQPCYM